MADYVNVTELKTRHNITAATNDITLAEVVTEASRMVDGICGRRFDADEAATDRVFHPTNGFEVRIDDALEITAVATDNADDGTYGTTWAAGDYQTLPMNGVGLNRQSGWPVTKLLAVSTRSFPNHRRPSVQVTAKWGWAAVPADIKAATYFLAYRLYEERQAPFGTVGNADFGALPIRDQRTVMKLLAPYKRMAPAVA